MLRPYEDYLDNLMECPAFLTFVGHTPMQTARLYNCVRCHCQVFICSPCDRGNIYCTNGCADLARRELQSESNQRYQKTYRGKLKHAARQKNYMLRIQQNMQIMTYQGSQNENNDVKSDQRLTSTVNTTDVKTCHKICCNFCGQQCSNFTRNDFLRSTSVIAADGWPLGP